MKWIMADINSNDFGIEGVNSKEGIARFGGKKEPYIKVLHKFASGLDIEKMLPFSEAMKAENDEETKRFVHSLKGTAGNLSVTGIYQKAMDFERSMHDGAPDEKLYNELIQICGELKERILAAIAPQSNAGSSVSAGSGEEYRKILSELLFSLSQFDAESADGAVTKLKAKNWPGAQNDKLKMLYDKVENFDYDTAISLIKDLIK